MNNLQKLSIAILSVGIYAFSSISFAQTGVPPTPQVPLPSGTIPTTEQIQKGKELLQQERQVEKDRERPAERELPPSPSEKREYSTFEQELSRKLAPKLEIRDSQLEILKVQPGIIFSYTPLSELPVGSRMLNLPPEIGGGFIAGPPQALSNALKAAGIKQPIASFTEIRQFGYELFGRPPTTFTPVDIVPVGPDYLLGPEDEIRISVWGKVNAEYPTMIDRDGQISLPQIGILHLSGLTFQEAKSFLEKEFSRYYKSSEVKMNVSMGRLRTIRVFVVGKAQRPGSYTLSSFSTLINALFAAGGPSKIGSMRDIQVKRNGGTVVHFDLYDFLLKGDKTKDIRLMPEDVIFIPPVGHLVGIAGNVKDPAIYELKDEARLLDLFQMAGGLTPTAFKGRMQVHRIIDYHFTMIFEKDLADLEKDPGKNFTLMDGDLVKIFPVLEGNNTAHIIGAVANPGEYGVMQGVTKVSDVISMAGGLLYYASNQAELTRLKVTQAGAQIERFAIDLSKAIEGDASHNLPLEINDRILVKTIPEWRFYRTAEILGEVRFPGAYTIQKGETLSSLIERAGGFTDKAYLKGAIFTRELVKELQQRHLDEAIDRLEQQFLSQSAATIETATTAESAQQQRASMEQRRALIAKMKAAKAKGRIAIQLDRLEKFKGSLSDLTLEDGDILFIPLQPEQVQVGGAVYNPTAFVYNPKAKVSAYLKQAGGMTTYADKDELYVLKVDGTAISKKSEGLWTSLESSRPDPGDTIVVPEKLERIAWMREIRDITQILYQIAVTAGVLIVAF